MGKPTVQAGASVEGLCYCDRFVLLRCKFWLGSRHKRLDTASRLSTGVHLSCQVSRAALPSEMKNVAEKRPQSCGFKSNVLGTQRLRAAFCSFAYNHHAGYSIHCAASLFHDAWGSRPALRAFLWPVRLLGLRAGRLVRLQQRRQFAGISCFTAATSGSSSEARLNESLATLGFRLRRAQQSCNIVGACILHTSCKFGLSLGRPRYLVIRFLRSHRSFTPLTGAASKADAQILALTASFVSFNQ